MAHTVDIWTEMLSAFWRQIKGICLLILVTAVYYGTVYGQTVSKAEYYIDTDPGIGKGYALTLNSGPGEIFTAVYAQLGVSGISAGPHTFYIRYQNNKGVWGNSAGVSFNVAGPASNPQILIPSVSEIIKAEYFLDSDPGMGNGTVIPVINSTSEIFAAAASQFSTVSLAQGPHTLYIRFQNKAGIWGNALGSALYVSGTSANPVISFPVFPKIRQAEYYVDTDPGKGSGVQFLFTDGQADAVFESISGSLSTAGLSPGPHSLYVRMKNSIGEWGEVYGISFSVTAIAGNFLVILPNQVTIAQAEFYIDEDPGEGKAYAIFTDDGNFNETLESVSAKITTNDFSEGPHTLFLRLKNSSGKWGSSYGKSFYISKAGLNPYIPLSIQKKVTAAEYYIDNDPGAGRGIPINAKDGEFDEIFENISVGLNDVSNPLPEGTHTLWIRYRNSGGMWGNPAGTSFTIANINPPEVPSGLNAAIRNRRVILSWNTNSEADMKNYLIYRSTTANFAPVVSDTIATVSWSDTVYTDKKVVNGTTYYYRIAAVDLADNISQPSGQLSAVPVNSAPHVVSRLRDIIVNEDTSEVLIGPLPDCFSDIDGDSLTYFVTGSDNSKVKPSIAGRNLKLTFFPNIYGDADITVYASDGELNTPSSFHVTVRPVNDLPVMTGLAASYRFKADSESTLNLYNMVSDIETPDSLLRFEFTYPADSVKVGFDKVSGRAVVSALNGITGNFSLLISCTDEAGAAVQGKTSIQVADIKVSSPNGKESWQVGSIHQITWEARNTGNVKIEYSTNSGSTWSTITSAIPAAMGSYEWNVPIANSQNCVVKVTDLSSSAVSDVSDSAFSIIPSAVHKVVLLKPNGGEMWKYGAVENILWNVQNVSNIKIEYSVNDGAAWSSIADNISASQGTYPWNIPNVLSSKCRIRLSEAGNMAVQDASDSTFSITNTKGPALTVSVSGIQFGGILVNSSAEKSFNITNNGDELLSVKSISNTKSVFSALPGSFNLTPGAVQQVSVKFNPVQIGSWVDSLIINSNAGAPGVVVISGEAINSASAYLSAAVAVSFGEQKTGAAVQKDFIITNTGTAVLAVTGITAGNSAFTVQPQSFSLAPGSERILTIRFSPSQAVTYSSAMTIYSNAVNNPFAIALTGSGFTYPASVTVAKSILFENPDDIRSYRIVGLPGNADISLGEVMTGKAGYDWNASWDNGAASNYKIAYDGSSIFRFKAGKAFWVISKSELKINRLASTVPLTSANDFSIPLHPGWNLISSPFEKAVSWTKVQQQNSLPQNAVIYDWSGSYSQSLSFNPYQGYYFNNVYAIDSLKIPYNSSGNISLAKLSKENEGDELAIKIFDNGKHVSEVYLGFSNYAEKGFDSLDYFMPPDDFESSGIKLFNENLQTDYKYLCREKRPDRGEGEVFVLSLKNQTRSILKMEFKGAEKFSDKEICLAEKGIGRFINIKEEPVINIPGFHSSSEYILAIGSRKYIEEMKKAALPHEFDLRQNFPNPFNPYTLIMYSLPVDSYVEIDIFDALGRRAARLRDTFESAGTYEINWHPEGLSSGLYFCVLRARTSSGVYSFSAVRKMMYIK